MVIRYISYEAVLEIYGEIINKMGGKLAILNEGNLRYCIDSVIEVGNHISLIDSCIQKSAFYLCCISEGHGLLDYNKRTAYEVADVFLRLNGFKLRIVDSDEVVMILRRLSSKQITIDNVTEWVSKHIIPISS